MGIEEEIEALKREMKRLGTQGDRGVATVKYGVLVRDDRVSNILEALMGTLRAAKKRGVVDYEGQLLLQGAHDDVNVILLEE